MQFDLRLDPPEMGRVDVRLEVGRDQRVSATSAADNPAALTDLVRAAREIEQALQSAGLQLREDGLRFDLAERNSGQNFADARASGGGGRAEGEADTRAESAAPAARLIGLERWRGVRVDLVA